MQEFWADYGPRRDTLIGWALAVSLLLHIIALLIPAGAPPRETKSSPLQATLSPPRVPIPVVPPTPRRPTPVRVLTAKGGSGRVQQTPHWSAAEKADMSNFLDSLERESKRNPPPTLAQRSLAAAREIGRQMAQEEAAPGEMLERIPNSPPADPFSLEMYVEGLVKKLNRSAAFVRNDPRSKGMRTATVRIRINPDGSLKSFEVLNAADQQEEIAYVRSVVERAVPFSNFPPDLLGAARSLGMLICIQPASGGDGFGFTRNRNGRCS